MSGDSIRDPGRDTPRDAPLEVKREVKPTDVLANLSGDEKRALLARLLAKKEATNSDRQSQLASPKPLPLSHAQRRLWFMDQLYPGQISYHIPTALLIEGELDADRLANALDQVVARHESLRTCFRSTDGEPHVLIDDSLFKAKDKANDKASATNRSLLEVETLTAVVNAKDTVKSQLQHLITQPFDLATGPLLRVKLLKESDQRHYLLLCVHHIIADYWSLRILVREITLLYSGAAALPALPIQYVDYAAWQQKQKDALTPHLDYWKTQLSHLPPALSLPQDHPRPPQQSTRGDRYHFTLDSQLSERLNALAKRHQVSLFVTLLTAFNTLLHRYTGQDDILIGSTISNRSDSQTRDLIGLFVNNLVFRTRMQGNEPFTQLLQQVKQTALDAFAHQDLPFEQLVDQLKVERRLDRHPLFQVLFVLHNTPQPAIELPGLSLRGLEVEQLSTRFDLGLDMVETAQGLKGTFEYSTDLFERDTIDQIYRQFHHLLEAICENPDQTLTAIDWDTQQSLRTELNGPDSTTYPDLAVSLKDAVTKHSNNIALVFDQNELTYQQLWQYSDQLSQALQSGQLNNFNQNNHIAICLPRSIELVVALITCLRLGIPYVPLDIRQPAERLRAMLEDAQPALILYNENDTPDDSLLGATGCATHSMSLSDLASTTPSASLPDFKHTTPDQLAYTIFTSGSTGRPKGVPITRGALSNFLSAMQRLVMPDGQAPENETSKNHCGWLAITTVGFDIAALELLLPLCSGNTLVLANEQHCRDGAALNQLMLDRSAADQPITHLQATPASYRMLLDSGWKGQQGLTMLCGGEALESSLALELLQDGRRLWNVYGPTETTIWSTALPVTRTLLQSSTGKLPIGSPLQNTWLQVVDGQLRPLPPGICGELLIGGEGLSPGYLNRPDLTEEKFIQITDAHGQSRRAYRTGDRVRLRRDGLLDFLGRTDHQIKLRGFRIEPGEIESVLNRHSLVEQSVVGLWQNGQNDAQLAVWIQSACSDRTAVIESLLELLAQHLPHYMHPSLFSLVEAFPLNSNGKIDRKSLPKPDRLNAANAEANVPLAGATEQTIAEIWNELLPVPVQSATDDFFSLGGHSLLAARMLARLNARLKVDIPLQSLFRHPQLRSLATHVQESAENGNQKPVSIQPLSREPNVTLPLSSAQLRQWVLAQLEPDSPFYNIPAAIEIEGNFQIDRFKLALTALMLRHENLRAVFSSSASSAGDPRLQIMESASPTIEVHEFTDENLDAESLNSENLDSENLDSESLATGSIESRTRSLLLDCARKPFNLSEGPLLRVTIVRTSDSTEARSRTCIMLVIHHILADAWSVQILMRELMQLYQHNNPQALPPLKLQYADYAAWQRAQDYSNDLNYWKSQLADAPPLLDLTTDYRRPVTQSFVGDSIPFQIDSALAEKLQQLARTHDATLFMVLMALFQWLLHRYSDNHDIVTGTPVGHRPDADLEAVIGLFANTLAIRTHLSGNETTQQLVEKVRHTTLQAFDHQHAPLDQVLDVLQVERNWSHAPLFQTMLLWQPRRDTAGEATGTRNWRPLPLDYQQSKFDLTLSLADSGSGIDGRLEYRTDLFRRETVENMAASFVTLLSSATQAPNLPLHSLNLVSEHQQRQLADWNRPSSLQSFWQQQSESLSAENPFVSTATNPLSALTLPDAFQQQVMKTPHAIALFADGREWDYQTLDQLSNALAIRLVEMGSGCERPVAVCLPRTAKLIVALLATLKSGAPYVPLDPAYPGARLQQIMENAQASLIICDPQQIPLELASWIESRDVQIVDIDGSDLNRHYCETAPGNALQPHNSAYLIYTSGSTGIPKGVTIEHQQVMSLLNWACEVYSPTQLQGVLASTSICFDLSVFEIFVPLCSGGSVILVDNLFQLAECQNVPSGSAESDFANKITLINTVPSALTQLLALGALPESVRTVNLAGEALPVGLVQKLYRQPGIISVYNLYGPSEDTTYSTGARLAADISDRQVVSIGRPITGTTIEVLDQHQQPVPPGMCGELYLSGTGVARGYWQQEEKTAERFDSVESVRRYRTGDRVRLRYDGELEYLGRLDHQVKIRGFRIETGEVETVLEQHPSVQQAVVAVKARTEADTSSSSILVAYILATDAHATDAPGLNQSLRQWVQQNLPNYMVPALIETVDSLPRLPNGKIDRQSLPEPRVWTMESSDSGITETTDNQSAGIQATDLQANRVFTQLESVWQQLLGRNDISPQAHFFELGGDSILAIQMVAKARELGMYLQPRDLFQYPTLSSLSLHVHELQKRKPHQHTISQSPVTGRVALLPAQLWFFEQKLVHAHHWNQSLLLEVKQPLDLQRLERAAQALAQQHDALRARYTKDNENWIQEFSATLPEHQSIVQLIRHNCDHTGQSVEDVIQINANRIQSSLDLQQAPLWRWVYFDLERRGQPIRRLLLVSHHLIVDGVSWRTLLQDLWKLYNLENEQQIPLFRTHSAQDWFEVLNQNLPRFREQSEYWKRQNVAIAPLPVDFNGTSNLMGNTDTFSESLSASTTDQWLHAVPAAYRIRSDELLIMALTLALQEWSGRETVSFWLEGHGRHEIDDTDTAASALDLSATVGWFTNLYPQSLTLSGSFEAAQAANHLDELIKQTKTTLRSVPDHGIGYGVIRWMDHTRKDHWALTGNPPVRFNYLGQSDTLFQDHPLFAPARESIGQSRHPDDKRDVQFDINALVSGGELKLHWSYSRHQYRAETIEQLSRRTLAILSGLIRHCVGEQNDGGYVAEDFPDMDFDNDELDALLDNI